MILEFKNNVYDTFEKREELVKLLACIVNANADFKPYCADNDDSYYWKIDSGNNWGVDFDRVNTKRVKVIYRYNKGHEEALCGWLTVKFRCTVVRDNE